MFRRLVVLSVLAWLCSTAAYCQDEPSLGDVARQVRSQKNSAQPKTVITNDDLSPASAGSLFGRGEPAGPNGLAKPESNTSPDSSLAAWESSVKYVQSLDRAALVSLALQGVRTDFPGRGNWENRLLTGRQAYVSQGQELLQRARQLQASAEELKSAHADAKDPRVKELMANLGVLVKEAFRADAEFRAIVLEGRDLARQTPAP